MVRHLLRHPGVPFSVIQLAARLKLHRANTYAALKALHLRGFVEIVTAHPTTALPNGRTALYLASPGPVLSLLATLKLVDPFNRRKVG